MRRDAFESNDSEESAVEIGSHTMANVYFFRSRDGQELSDWDWYKVKVPARSILIFRIDQNLPVGSLESYLYYYRPGLPAQPVANAGEINIENHEYEPAYYVFAVYPAEANFVPASGFGGMLKDYTIDFLQIVFM